MTPYRVILFASWYRHGLGFAGTELAMGLSKSGADVTAVSGPGEDFPGLIERLQSSGVPYKVCPGLDAPILKEGVRAARCLAEIAFNGERRDAVIFQCLGLRQVLLASAARLFSQRHRHVAIVVTVTSLRHGEWYERAAYIFGARFYARFADRIIALCGSEAAKLRRAGLPADKMTVIHNWKDIQAFLDQAEQPLPREIEETLSLSVSGAPLKGNWPRIVYPASYHRRKGHRLLIEALALLRDRGLDTNCVCVGGGEERSALETYAQTLEVADRLCLGPRIHNGLIGSLLRRADVVAIASRAETFGVAIIEPLILGVPVVTTRVGCASELEAAGGVRAVSNDDGPALAANLEWVLRNRSAALRLAQVGQRWVQEHCDLGAVVKRLRQVYLSIAEEGRGIPAVT